MSTHTARPADRTAAGPDHHSPTTPRHHRGATIAETKRPTYVNESNPAAYGAQCTAAATGTRYQLANPRGTDTLWFGMRPAGSDTWSLCAVVDPARFGPHHPPRTIWQFLAVVRTYLKEA